MCFRLAIHDSFEMVSVEWVAITPPRSDSRRIKLQASRSCGDWPALRPVSFRFLIAAISIHGQGQVHFSLNPDAHLISGVLYPSRMIRDEGDR